MERSAVVYTLNRIALCLEMLDENQFKIRAHRNAARAVEQYEGEGFDTLVVEGRLKVIPGVGAGIAKKITTLANTGALRELDDLQSKIPAGIFDILKVAGLGPKKTKTLWKKLGITSLGELEYACNENRLATLEGFGAATQQKILRGVEALSRYAGKRLLPDALTTAEKILSFLRADKKVIKASVTGDTRRHLEIVEKLELLVATDDPESVLGGFVSSESVATVDSQEDEKSAEVTLANGLKVILRVVSPSRYALALFKLTGTKTHNEAVVAHAATLGMTLSHRGVAREGDNTTIAIENEGDIYAAFGLAYVSPELREGNDEVELAAKNPQALDLLVTSSHVKGLFHCHTTYSDGWDSVAEMATACKKLGYGYLGISDHSKSAHYAGGLSIGDIARQSEEIDRVNDKIEDFRIFKGIESDILSDGSLDYPDEILASFDFVIASVHAGFLYDKNKMTAKIVRAANNPYTTMLGHMTGRLLLSREGYPLDFDAVFKACATNGVIIELNCNPQRLDIDWRLIRKAIKAGVKISINPDAHRVSSFAHAKCGVMAARKGGASRADVFNTFDAAAVTEYFASRKP